MSAWHAVMQTAVLAQASGYMRATPSSVGAVGREQGEQRCAQHKHVDHDDGHGGEGVSAPAQRGGVYLEEGIEPVERKRDARDRAPGRDGAAREVAWHGLA